MALVLLCFPSLQYCISRKMSILVTKNENSQVVILNMTTENLVVQNGFVTKNVDLNQF